MYNLFGMKSFSPSTIILSAAILLVTSNTLAQSIPALDQDFWENERSLAQGKIKRGAGLAVLGLASVVPSSILVNRAINSPHRYLAWSAVAGIATLGMTLHGFGSVGYGLE